MDGPLLLYYNFFLPAAGINLVRRRETGEGREEQVDVDEISRICDLYCMSYFSTSAKTGSNVDKVTASLFRFSKPTVCSSTVPTYAKTSYRCRESCIWAVRKRPVWRFRFDNGFGLDLMRQVKINEKHYLQFHFGTICFIY